VISRHSEATTSCPVPYRRPKRSQRRVLALCQPFGGCPIRWQLPFVVAIKPTLDRAAEGRDVEVTAPKDLLGECAVSIGSVNARAVLTVHSEVDRVNADDAYHHAL